METLLSMLMPSLIPWLGLVCVVINSSSVLFWRWGGWTFPVLLYNEVMAYDQKYVSLFYYGIICCQIYQSLCDISYSIIRFTGSWEQISNNKVFSVILTMLHCDFIFPSKKKKVAPCNCVSMLWFGLSHILDLCWFSPNISNLFLYMYRHTIIIVCIDIQLLFMYLLRII